VTTPARPAPAFDAAGLTCALPLRVPLQQQQCEHEEEYISNRLMKRLETRGSLMEAPSRWCHS
jgi:hypothetical protein